MQLRTEDLNALKLEVNKIILKAEKLKNDYYIPELTKEYLQKSSLEVQNLYNRLIENEGNFNEGEVVVLQNQINNTKVQLLREQYKANIKRFGLIVTGVAVGVASVFIISKRSINE